MRGREVSSKPVSSIDMICRFVARAVMNLERNSAYFSLSMDLQGRERVFLQVKPALRMHTPTSVEDTEIWKTSSIFLLSTIRVKKGCSSRSCLIKATRASDIFDVLVLLTCRRFSRSCRCQRDRVEIATEKMRETFLRLRIWALLKARLLHEWRLTTAVRHGFADVVRHCWSAVMYYSTRPWSFRSHARRLFFLSARESPRR